MLLDFFVSQELLCSKGRQQKAKILPLYWLAVVTGVILVQDEALGADVAGLAFRGKEVAIVALLRGFLALYAAEVACICSVHPRNYRRIGGFTSLELLLLQSHLHLYKFFRLLKLFPLMLLLLRCCRFLLLRLRLRLIRQREVYEFLSWGKYIF